MGSQQAKQKLLIAIETEQVKTSLSIIEKFPELLDEPLAGSKSATPLQRAAWRGSMDMTLSLIEIGAQLDKPDHTGITPLMWAAKRDHADIAITLIRSGANFRRRSMESLSALDYAILHGNYNSAYLIFEFDKMIQTSESYAIIQKMKNWRWVNFEQFIFSLQSGIPPHKTLDFYQQQSIIKIELLDPVIDPRETWGQMIKRIMNFEEPPMVERSELPLELQPQNRTLGKIRSYINGMDPNKSSRTYDFEKVDIEHTEIAQ